MLNMLKGIIGQKFLKYECAKDDVLGSTYGNIRLCFSDSTIELSNEEHLYTELGDDVACFSCILVSPDSPFKPAVVAETETTFIDSTVLGVEIVEDEVNINNSEVVINFDSALVLKTETGDYVFARTEWFSEVILIAHNESYDNLFTVEDVIESWENDGENQVSVQRSRKQL